MECAVYDTYVTKKDGRIMHFDVIVESSTPHEKAIEYGKEFLNGVGEGGIENDTGRMPILPYTRSSAHSRQRDQGKGLLHSENGRLPLKRFFNFSCLIIYLGLVIISKSDGPSY